ncbi:MAG: protein jag [Oscillospiraceae bacterium]|nr:protein jag [Oscillospiraceae bacterium]
MEKEFSAKTIEEAKELAAKEFGVSADEIEFDILEQPRKTLFGGLKGEARVNAIYEPAVEEPKKRIFEDDEEDIEEAGESAPEALDDEKSDDEEELPADFDVTKSLKVKTAVEYLTAVLKALGLEKFTITPEKRGGNVVLDIKGEKLGVVIGKRGETLDSLQYLTILASNRTEESFCRISLDCNGYRDKRRETLDALARKTSAKVIKQGRKIALEPMNPYERRIIHSCVAEIEGVSSRSTGSEPFRKVVIYADKPKFDNNRRRGGNHGSGSGARGYRRSEGFSTSFEREYKRSSYSPDENANAGEFSKETVDTERNATLYGKIEL